MTSYVYQIISNDGEDTILFTTASQPLARKVFKRVKEQDSPYCQVRIEKMDVDLGEPDFEWSFYGNQTSGYEACCYPVGFTSRFREVWDDHEDTNYIIIAKTKTKALRYIKKKYGVALKLGGQL